MKKNILVIITRGKRNKGDGANYLRSALKKKGCEYDFVDPSEVVLEVSSSIGHDKIYIRRNNKGDKKYDRIFKKSYDGVIIRGSRHINIISDIIRHLTKNIGVFCTSSYDGITNASKKFITHQIISAAGCRTPKTVMFSSPKDFKFLTDLVGGIGNGKKVVFKLSSGGSGGIGTIIQDSELAASTMLQTFYKKKIGLLLQKFIETAKKDENKADKRLIVVHGKVVCAIKRYSVKGDFRANLSGDGYGESYDWTPEEEALAVKASKAINLDGFCGVDIATDINTGLNYVIELNSCPGVKTIGLTKHNFFLDVVQMVIDKSKSHKPLAAINFNKNISKSELASYIKSDILNAKVNNEDYEMMGFYSNHSETVISELEANTPEANTPEKNNNIEYYKKELEKLKGDIVIGESYFDKMAKSKKISELEAIIDKDIGIDLAKEANETLTKK